MKTSLLTTLSILLLLFSMKFLLARSASEPVLDINNNQVTSDLHYVIREAVSGSTNVLSSHNGIGNAPCPFDVVQEPYLQNATLTTFSPLDGSTTINESTNLNVKYLAEIVYCGETEYPIWKIGNTSVSSTQWPIVVGDFNETKNGTWFRLEKVRINTEGVSVYKFVHCLTVCDSEICTLDVCFNLGISFVSGANRLLFDTTNESAFEFVLAPTAIPILRERIKLVTG